MHTTDKDYGVVSADASYDIVNGCTFEDLNNAIHILNSGGLSYPIQIDGTDLANDISGSSVGIYADFCNALSIKSNSIHNNFHGFATNNKSAYSVYGNFFENNSVYHIYNNNSKAKIKNIIANTFKQGGHGIYLRLHCENYEINFNCFEELGINNDISHYKTTRPILNRQGAPGFPALNFFSQPAGYSNDVATQHYTIEQAKKFIYFYPDPEEHSGINPRLIPRCDYEGDNCTSGGSFQRFDAKETKLNFGQIPNAETLCAKILTDYFDPDTEAFSYILFNNLTDSIYKYKAKFLNDTSDHESDHLAAYYDLQRKRIGHRLLMEYFTHESPDSLSMILDSISDIYQWDVLWSYYNTRGMNSLSNAVLNGASFTRRIFTHGFHP
jgi:hypothetical protein